MNELRKFIFINSEDSEEIILPITPPSYEIDHGIKTETVNLTELGDICLPGKRYMMSIKIDCVFPSIEYNFVNEGTVFEPYYYAQKFEKWCDESKILRFMISGTNINTTCFISSIVFGEKDGTNDIYATLTIEQYRVLSAFSIEATGNTTNNARAEETAAPEVSVYTIVSGDTLSGICRKLYGDSSLYQKLANYNAIANANLIYAGTTIKIPDKTQL
ncbi:MAG: LysM peptidoglycan-binding domain-containing protein [Lachnospiraceae bacterium]|nr:LysM peptidoglycan-binding domain-containing protein [Lachnospiraceae bacterium]